MKLALQTDYALRTLLYLAIVDRQVKVDDVASYYDISSHHVRKVVHQLGKLGLVRTLRGVAGGIRLAKSPDDVRVGQVITAFEGNTHLLECVGVPNVCVIQPACKLRGVLAEAERLQMDYLNSVRLSDLVPEQTGAGGLVTLSSKSA